MSIQEKLDIAEAQLDANDLTIARLRRKQEANQLALDKLRLKSLTPVVFDHINLRKQPVPWYRRLLRFLARR